MQAAAELLGREGRSQRSRLQAQRLAGGSRLLRSGWKLSSYVVFSPPNALLRFAPSPPPPPPLGLLSPPSLPRSFIFLSAQHLQPRSWKLFLLPHYEQVAQHLPALAEGRLQHPRRGAARLSQDRFLSRGCGCSGAASRLPRARKTQGQRQRAAGGMGRAGPGEGGCGSGAGLERLLALRNAVQKNAAGGSCRSGRWRPGCGAGTGSCRGLDGLQRKKGQAKRKKLREERLPAGEP